MNQCCSASKSCPLSLILYNILFMRFLDRDDGMFDVQGFLGLYIQTPACSTLQEICCRRPSCPSPGLSMTGRALIIVHELLCIFLMMACVALSVTQRSGSFWVRNEPNNDFGAQGIWCHFDHRSLSHTHTHTPQHWSSIDCRRCAAFGPCRTWSLSCGCVPGMHAHALFWSVLPLHMTRC